jgi:hypothetical protein
MPRYTKRRPKFVAGWRCGSCSSNFWISTGSDAQLHHEGFAPSWVDLAALAAVLGIFLTLPGSWPVTPSCPPAIRDFRSPWLWNTCTDGRTGSCHPTARSPRTSEIRNGLIAVRVIFTLIRHPLLLAPDYYVVRNEISEKKIFELRNPKLDELRPRRR